MIKASGLIKQYTKNDTYGNQCRCRLIIGWIEKANIKETNAKTE
jgi:hypothetical protein